MAGGWVDAGLADTGIGGKVAFLAAAGEEIGRGDVAGLGAQAHGDVEAIVGIAVTGVGRGGLDPIWPRTISCPVSGSIESIIWIGPGLTLAAGKRISPDGTAGAAPGAR